MQHSPPRQSTPRDTIAYLPALLLALLLGCAQQEPVEKLPAAKPIEHPPETAQRVSTATSGTIAAADPIKVRFVKPGAESDQVGHALKKRVFTFTPSIDGITEWETTHTLVFRPNRPLPMRQQYQGQLDLAGLLPADTEGELQPLRFEFSVAGREILSLDGDFDLKTANDPRYLVYKGQMEFTAPTDSQAVREATVLRRGETLLPLAWHADPAGKVFSFTSPVLERDTIRQVYELTVDDRPLDISNAYEKKIALSPLQDMRLETVKREETGDHPRLTLLFSDELDVRQDIAGLVQVRPDAGIKLKAMGKQIIVDGDFAHGQGYTLEVHPGIRSRWGTRTEKPTSQAILFADLKPQLRFARDGVFLPSAKNKRLRFATLNVSRVYVDVKKVYSSNLGQFLQTERLGSAKDRRDHFSNHNVDRVGVRIAGDTLDVADDRQRNTWLEHELDLGELIAADEQGIFLVGLRFDHGGMLYRPTTAEALQIRRRYNRRDDPTSSYYLRSHGQAHKAVILSDIGLTYKRSHDQHLVYATRIDDARPLAGAAITMRSYQNQVIATATTDDRGLARLGDVDRNVFYIEAEFAGQRSVIKPGDMAWNLSSFDTGGVESLPGATRAFIYSERGVYRPGDDINLSVVARHQDHTFPADHPVTCKIFNPRDQLAFEQTQRGNREGLYNFAFATRPDDPTGNWRAQILIGYHSFDHVIKVETVVPYRLKTEIAPDKPRLGRDDETLAVDVRSAYLFGSPAAGLEAELGIALRSAAKTFPRYENFSFTNELIDYQTVQATLFKGKLDSKGRARVEWTLPALANAPSAVEAVLEAKVLEKGGRPNYRQHRIPIDPYDHYVGLQKPELPYGYARVGTSMRIPAIATDARGEPVAGRSLRYRVYKGFTHWWWEYENREAFHRRFKSDRRTEIVSEQRLVSGLTPVELSFEPADRGTYLIEVADGDDGGHVAAFLVRAYHWGRSPQGEENGGLLVLQSDRERYAPGDQAYISFPVPAEGSILFSVEQGGRIIDERWYRLDGSQEEANIPFTVTVDMIPTAYASVSLIQPHGQTDNDRPIRLFGVLPIEVQDPATRLDFAIDMPAALRPNELFEVAVQSSLADSVEFTLAVVDEGLLALTDFQTPDPWKFFFQKLRLSVRTFDLFSHVIGVAQGDPFKTFSIGGGFAAKRDAQRDKRRRFPAVSMFAGPLSTDAAGRAAVRFKMPNYVGAVRAMVVGAKGGRFGRGDKTVEVKSDLMVLPTLPRVIGPGDIVKVPVTVFAMTEGLGTVDVSISADGPLELIGEPRKSVDFSGVGERDVLFELRAKMAVGPATVEIAAEAVGARATRRTDLTVRPSSPPIYESVERSIEPGDALSLTIPDRGLPGTNKARVSVRRWPNFNFDNQMLRLVRYPYGCIEQTVSSVFPQLYLKDLLDLSPEERAVVAADIDERINAAVKRLRLFQRSDGSFSYWPGNRQGSTWGTNYAGHFMVEARKLGYHIPDDMYQDWVKFQRSQAVMPRDNLMVRVYRAYLLALAGEPEIGAMNLLKENELANMKNVQKWLLATAYLHAGVPQTADEIARAAGTEVSFYREFANTYGSDMRDKALILDALVALGRWDAADPLAKELAQALSQNWHSTQTTAVGLLAMGKYVLGLRKDGGPQTPITGTIRLPGGQAAPFSSEALGYQADIASGFGDEVEVRLDPGNAIERAFVTLDWEGVPLQGPAGDEESQIKLQLRWLDEDGRLIAPDTLAQGTSFWAHIRIANGSVHSIEEVALTQILPAGWEIENTRLTSRDRPQWMSSWQLNREEYLDIRDDRVNWFMDLPRRGRSYDFAVKINAVSQGVYTLPPTYAEAMYNREFRARKAGRTIVVGP